MLTTWGMYWWRMRSTVRRATKAMDGPELKALRELQQASVSRADVQLRLSDSNVGPGAYGMRRSILIWPSRISRRLNDAQIKSVLAHEPCHIERHDNLTAAIHMAVEALFWFHPLVWWLGSQLELERERACDEHVVQTMMSPQTYAESILKVCELCLAPPPECVSGVTGGNLKERVRRIMTDPTSQRLTTSRKVLLAAIASGSIAVPILFGQVRNSEDGQTQGHAPLTSKQTLSTIAQTAQGPSIHLDVVSIKENRSEQEKGYLQIPPNGSRLIVRNTPCFVSSVSHSTSSEMT